MSNTVYDSNFYETQSVWSFKSASIIVPLIISLFNPKSVLDVWCGVWTWLKAFQDNWVEDVFGLDWTYVDTNKLFISPSKFKWTNLSQPIDLWRKFDLVMSLEVAEHIDSKYAHTFVSNITNHWDIVVFGAAAPTFGWGTDHVNEQLASYWINIFDSLGYVAFDPIRLQVIDNNDVEWFYKQNILVYIKKDIADKFSHLRKYNPDFILVYSLVFSHYDNFFTPVWADLKILVANVSRKLYFYDVLKKIYDKFK